MAASVCLGIADRVILLAMQGAFVDIHECYESLLTSSLYVVK